MKAQDAILCAALAVGVAYLFYIYTKKSEKLYMIPRDAETYIPKLPTEKFYVYNYYKVPITVKVSENEIVNIGKIEKVGTYRDVTTIGQKSEKDERTFTFMTLIENVQPNKFGVITDSKWQNITDNKKITIYDSKTNELIGESIMTIPQGKTIKALHCGMNSGHTDIAISGDITKSPLGTALPRLRIVNVTPRTIKLTTTGGNKLTIPPAKSLLYFGEYENGIPMGVTFKDIDGILPDYNLKIPLTDLFLGIISDIEIPLYRNSKIGGSFFDDPGVMYHPFEELRGYQLHRGAFIDKSYIPKNW
jgi:hypothetical protein